MFDGSCMPCDQNTCFLCTGTSYSQCYRPLWKYYFDGSAYSRCSTGCDLCTGLHAADCLQCSGGYVLDYDNVCRPSCTPPYQSVGDGDAKMCQTPCLTGEYLDWNNNCISSCDFPFLSVSKKQGNFCNYPCNSTNGEYLLSDGTCGTSCIYSVKNQSGYLFCGLTQSSQHKMTSIEAIVAVKEVTNILLVSGIFIAVMLSINDPTINTLAGFIKMLLCIRYMKINYPPRLQYMLDHLESSVLSFEFGFEMPPSLRNKFSQYSLPENFTKHTLNSDFLVSYWPTLTSLLMIFCFSRLLLATSLLLKKYANLNALIQRINLGFRWNFVMLVFCTNFDQIILQTSFQLRTLHLNSVEDKMSTYFCIFMNIVGTVRFQSNYSHHSRFTKTENCSSRNNDYSIYCR